MKHSVTFLGAGASVGLDDEHGPLDGEEGEQLVARTLQVKRGVDRVHRVALNGEPGAKTVRLFLLRR